MRSPSNWMDGKYGSRSRGAVAAIATALLLTACGGTSTESGAPAPSEETASSGEPAAPAAPEAPQVLVVGQSAPIQGNFNAFILSAGNRAMMAQLYDTLTRTGPGLEPLPRLAESWEVAADGLSISLTLREAAFADGTPITSADVERALAFAQNPDSRANARVLATKVTSIETPSSDQVVMRFDAPFPGIFDMLDLLPIIDQGTIDSNFAAPNASGPFALDTYTPEVGFTLVPNAEWWGPEPSLDTIEVKFLNNSQTQILALQAGDINFVDEVSDFDYTVLRDNAKYVTGFAGGANSVAAMTINVTDPVLSDPRVRLALARAIDRERIVRQVRFDASEAACLPFNTPGQLGYDDDLAASCEFDLAEAKALLDEAGVADLTLTLVTSGQISTDLPRTAEIIQADLASIGVTIVIEDLDAAAYREQASQGTFAQLLIQRYGRANLDPDTLFSATNAWKTKGNASRFDNEEYVSLVAEAGQTLDVAARASLYRRINELVLAENFVIPIATNPKPWVATADVSGVENNVNGQFRFENVSIG